MAGKGSNQVRGINLTVWDYLVNIQPQYLNRFGTKVIGPGPTAIIRRQFVAPIS